jgi:hypothetical protein
LLYIIKRDSLGKILNFPEKAMVWFSPLFREGPALQKNYTQFNVYLGRSGEVGGGKIFKKIIV